MTMIDVPIGVPTFDEDLARDVERAASRIAPAWPLDRLVAASPYWGLIEQPIEDAAAHLAALAGARVSAPRDWLRRQANRGVLRDEHLHRVHELDPAGPTVAAMRKALDEPSPQPARMRLVTDLVDESRGTARNMAWREFVVQAVGEACGAIRGGGQASWGPDAGEGLFAVWRQLAMGDASPRLLMGLRGFRRFAGDLPADARTTISLALGGLNVAPERRAAYMTALLASVPGWAGAFAYERFRARLHGRDDDGIVELLAVRIAWELALTLLSGAPDLEARWARARSEWDGLVERARREQRVDWALQRAIELGYQEGLVQGLADPGPAATSRPTAQVVMCIDVRSERVRRHLEAAHPTVETLGFAGFFGLGADYVTAGGARRAQLPGPLAPAFEVRDSEPDGGRVAEARGRSAALAGAWARFTKAAASAFTAVETTGLGFAAALLAAGFSPLRPDLDPLRGATAEPDGELDEFTPRPRPRVVPPEGGGMGALVDLAEGILRGMGLTRNFASVVALVGHGARVTNNPQASGLACGACGGHSGEVNARAVAALLDDHEVRAGLARQGIHIPWDTRFVAGLHETVTDDVRLFDLDALDGAERSRAEALQDALLGAGALARRERAPSLGLADVAGDHGALRAALERRASDWSEVRPEWGLAGNAAIVIAPRERTRGVDLGGRVFLHEYRHGRDPGSRVLEQILTAPVVVAHWINMQYHAAVVDPDRLGSGDKVLHNVLGGDVGVLEGAGGDLRVGLARQSVHDGEDWVHEPLRLSVLVEAPAGPIDGILERHAAVGDLVRGGWLHLMRIDGDGAVHVRTPGGWRPFGG